MRARTLSGKGIGFASCFLSSWGSAESSCLIRFDAEGEEGSSEALRLAPVHV